MRILRMSVPVVAVLALALVAGCSSDDNFLYRTPIKVTGSGTVVAEDRAVSGCLSVTHMTEGQLNIVQGATEGLTIRADDNLLPLIQTVLQGTHLIVRTAPNHDIEPSQTIEMDLTVVDLEAVTFSGIGEVRVTGIAVDDLDIDLTGIGPVTTSGTVTNQDVLLSGIGSYQGASLASTNATVVISGTGDATVNVTGTLDATISGMGSVYYYGPPATIIENVTGTGSVQPGP